MMVYPHLEEAYPLWGYGLLGIGLYVWLMIKSWFSKPKIPLVGVRSRFEARLISNFRFYKDAENILLEGHTNVRTVFHTLIHGLTRS